MTKKKKATAAATGVVAMALLFAGSFAWVSNMQTATNKFKLSDYNVVLHDKFNGEEVVTNDSEAGEYTSKVMEWKPNEKGDKELDKDVWVTNNGSGDILVRVRLTETLNVQKNGGSVIDVSDFPVQLNGIGENKVYNNNTKNIRDYVQWNLGTEEWIKSKGEDGKPKIMSYSEWMSLSNPEDKVGPFWLKDEYQGYLYWMQPLEATAQADRTLDEAGTTGNTALLLDSVKLLYTGGGQVDYNIKVQMSAIDADLMAFGEDGFTGWNLGNGITILTASANANRIADIKDKKNAEANVNVKKMYNELIEMALAGKSDEELNAFQTQIDEYKKILNNPDYAAKAITTSDGGTTYTLTNEAHTPIDSTIAQLISEKYDNKAITELTKADLAGIISLNSSSKGIESFSGLTPEYFPKLKNINFFDESKIDANDINNMDAGMKKQLVEFVVHENNTNHTISGDIDMSSYENLKKLYLRNCTKLNSVVGISDFVEDLNIEGSLIKTLNISNCPNLKKLNLWGCRSLGTEIQNPETEEAIIGLKDAQNLQALIASRNGMEVLNIENANSLTHLGADGCASLTKIIFAPKAFTKVAEGNTAGVILDIRNSKYLTSINIENMTLLSELDVTGCTGLVKEQVILNSNQKLIGTIPDNLK